MLEKLNAKTIVSRSVAFLFIIFLIFIFPPPSITFLFLAFGVVTLTLLTAFFSLKQRNAKLNLVAHIGMFTFFFLLGLRFWDSSIGLSFRMLVCLIPGLVLASLLPFISFSLSERLYAAEWFLGSTNLILLTVLGLANIVFVLVLWQLFEVVEVKSILSMPLVILGFFSYIIQLIGMQSSVHMYVSGYLQHRLNGNKEASVR